MPLHVQPRSTGNRPNQDEMNQDEMNQNEMNQNEMKPEQGTANYDNEILLQQ